MTMIVVLNAEILLVQNQLRTVIIAQQIVELAVEIISAIMVKHVRLALETAHAQGAGFVREECAFSLQFNAEMEL
jgi:hypothetical protein